ncbi:MAG: hypothetical protein CMJ40_10945 [Phycisphaerae bacterium]|nr:hypothetical protein [Phycisphaerae bacterium]|tara:strand:- start:94 stop:750 length:657 start_codon:yes stop_codon:yes gene_type:complete
MLVLSLLVPFLIGMGDSPQPLVKRGGDGGGAETVSIQLGNGVVGVWDIRTGTLLKGLIRTHQSDVSLELEVDPPSWFMRQGENDQKIVSYSWRGYRIEDGNVVLMHELRSPTGEVRNIQERPESTVGINGLLAIRSTFDCIDGGDGSSRVIKRIRTGTPGGVTMPIATNGHLVPLGLNDNFLADVVFRTSGSTQVTISFNGHWIEKSSKVASGSEASK